MNRRRFLGTSALAVAAAAIPTGAAEMPTLLVLGGTNFLGRAVVAAALGLGHKVTLFNRAKSHPGLFPQAEHLRGDRNGDLTSLEGRNFDWVIDTSGQRPSQVRPTTRMLSSSRYLYVSSISAYADKSTHGLHEMSPLVQPGPDEELEKEEMITYGERKVRCEQITRESMGELALIVRPCLIVGPHDITDRFTYWPMRFAQGGRILAPGTPDDPIQWVDVRDLALFMLVLLNLGATGIYNGVGPAKAGTIGQLMQVCADVCGAPCEVVWVPSQELEKFQVSAWQDMPTWVPPLGESAGFVRVDNRKALQAGLRLRPLRETVKATWDWKRSTGEAVKAGISREREMAVLAHFPPLQR